MGTIGVGVTMVLKFDTLPEQGAKQEPGRMPAPGKLFRYGLAMIGPVGSAGAQFLLSLILLRVLVPDEFGRFSFLLIASQLSWGVWSALFCAPLPLLIAQEAGTTRDKAIRSIFAVNLVGALLAAILFFFLARLLGETMAGAALFGSYAGIALLRWTARAHAYAIGHPLRTTASDSLYALILLAGSLILALRHSGSGTEAGGLLLLSSLAGLVPFGRAWLARQFGHLSLSVLSAYLPIWRQHARWALTGVITTEATANAHVYLVTALRGPGAFAPLAASALLIRPITVAMNALTEFERAQMARQIGEQRLDEAMGAVRFFRWMLVAAWVATAIAATALFALAPHLVFPAHYDLPFLLAGTALWMIVGGIRALRMPESTLLQAGGAFQPLAYASLWSCGLSLVAVLALLLAAGALWSIAGVMLGELVFAFFIWRAARHWLRDRKA